MIPSTVGIPSVRLCRAGQALQQNKKPHAAGAHGQPFPCPGLSVHEEPEEVCECHGHTQLNQEKRTQLWKLATWTEGKGCIT